MFVFNENENDYHYLHLITIVNTVAKIFLFILNSFLKFSDVHFQSITLAGILLEKIKKRRDRNRPVKGNLANLNQLVKLLEKLKVALN